MFALHEDLVDGVRCFWVETGRPTLAAQLIFRQGMADEWLAESGWLHMLEHLALHGRGGGRLEVNGSVSLLHTTFDAHGPAELVADHLTQLSGWLAAPVFHEFDRERGVLEAESRLRSGSIARRALGWRYGSIGPGTASFDEPGIARSTPEALTARSHWAYNRGNAVLVLDGPPPPGLRLELPAGELRRPPTAVPCGDTLPAAYAEPGGLIVSGVVNRSAAAMFVPELLQEAFTERLRKEAGAAYAPWASYEPVDDKRALVLAGSDLLPSLLPTIADTALDVVRQLATLGPTHEQLDNLRVRSHQALHDPYAAMGLAARAAHATLNSRAPASFAQVVDELLSVGDKDVKAEALAFYSTLMVGLPAESTWREQIARLDFPRNAPRLPGRSFRHRNWPAVPTRLVVAAQGLELVERGRARTILFEDSTGLYAFGDGGRHLVSHEGWVIPVDPDAWQAGAKAVAAIDQMAPRELALPQRARTGPIFERSSLLRRWTTWLRRGTAGRFGKPIWITLLVLMLVGGVALVLASVLLNSGASGYRLVGLAMTVAIVGAVIVSLRD